MPDKLLDEILRITPASFDFGNVTLNAGDNLLRFEVVTKKGTAAPQFSLINATFTPVQIFPECRRYFRQPQCFIRSLPQLLSAFEEPCLESLWLTRGRKTKRPPMAKGSQ